MKDILRRHAFSVSFLAILLFFVLFSGGGDGEIQRFSGYTMGTTYDVQVVELPSVMDLAELRSDVAQLLDRLDREIFSTYAPESELSRFNRAPVGTAFNASDELLAVLEMALNVSRLSAGAFDVTVGPLVNLWGFGPAPQRWSGELPDEEKIMQARQLVGFQYLDIDRGNAALSKTRQVSVDLSAIAKGYAVDRVAQYLESLNLDSYFVEIGGELRMRGLKPGAQSWIPAIEAPADSESRVYEVFFSRGDAIAVAGSGDYRNFFEEAGVRYSHEIDPRSGLPISHNLAAAYVIDESAARADALATTFMILGTESARRLAAQLDQAVYLIYKNEDGGFEAFISEPFEYYLDR